MQPRRRWPGGAVLLAGVCAAATGAAAPHGLAAQAGRPRISRDVHVGQSVWSDADITLQPGERAVFTAKGSATCPGGANSFGPEGLPRGFRDLLRILPVTQAGRGALVGRIGAATVAQPFVIGTGVETTSPTGGVLALGINRSDSDPCAASFTVHVDVFPRADGAAPVAASRVEALPGVGDDLFGRLPRRIGDEAGNPGDMVNFLILGSEDGMKAAFSAAGWVMVDADVRNAIISGVIGSLSKESYLTMPMSQLYLFGHAQDYGWAHAEPIKVVQTRHHLRVWRAPFSIGDETLWVGAATHDIGFERDRRNNGVTHKIDPDVDVERQFVEQTLADTGLVSELTYVLPRNPIQEARTATGGSFHSDGRVLVLKLAAPGPAASQDAPAP
jgi:LssY C-terminus